MQPASLTSGLAPQTRLLSGSGPHRFRNFSAYSPGAAALT